MADYTVITSKQAQEEHEALAAQPRVAHRHRAKSWRNCESCKSRMERVRIRVIN